MNTTTVNGTKMIEMSIEEWETNVKKIEDQEEDDYLLNWLCLYQWITGEEKLGRNGKMKNKEVGECLIEFGLMKGNKE